MGWAGPLTPSTGHGHRARPGGSAGVGPHRGGLRSLRPGRPGWERQQPRTHRRLLVRALVLGRPGHGHSRSVQPQAARRTVSLTFRRDLLRRGRWRLQGPQRGHAEHACGEVPRPEALPPGGGAAEHLVLPLQGTQWDAPPSRLGALAGPWMAPWRELSLGGEASGGTCPSRTRHLTWAWDSLGPPSLSPVSSGDALTRQPPPSRASLQGTGEIRSPRVVSGSLLLAWSPHTFYTCVCMCLCV